MKVVQLDFFQELFPETVQNDNKALIIELKQEVEKLSLSNERVRKSLFAKHGALAKLYLEIHQRLEILERNICKGK
mgnify:CR=1 FL=1